jgi:hypothetical protein
LESQFKIKQLSLCFIEQALAINLVQINDIEQFVQIIQKDENSCFWAKLRLPDK